MMLTIKEKISNAIVHMKRNSSTKLCYDFSRYEEGIRYS